MCDNRDLAVDFPFPSSVTECQPLKSPQDFVTHLVYPNGGRLPDIGYLLRLLDGHLVEGRPQLLVADLDAEAEVAGDAVRHRVDVEHVDGDLELDAIVVVGHVTTSYEIHESKDEWNIA